MRFNHPIIPLARWGSPANRVGTFLHAGQIEPTGLRDNATTGHSSVCARGKKFSVFAKCCWLGLLLGLVGCAPKGERVEPVDLRCECEVNPLGIDSPRPRLFWRLESPARGARQTAYQVLVASRADLLERNRGDLWDSGRVVSGQTTFVAYAGKPLASRQDCFWKVRIWDQRGRASAWSAPAT